MKLYCGNGILFGVILADGSLEVKCRSRRCGHEPGVLVFHRFDLTTGKEKEGSPVRYRDPAHDQRKVNG